MVAAPLDVRPFSHRPEENSEAQDIVVQGELATILDRSGIQNVSISDPASPAVVGEFSGAGTVAPLGQCYDLRVRSGIAFIAAGTQGLSIVDNTNPAMPVEIRRRRINITRPDDSVYPALAQSVLVDGGQVYVGTASNGVRIIDISDLTATGAYATLGVFQVLDPTINLARPSYALAKTGNLLYVANHQHGLRIVDVSVPTSPVQVGHYQPPPGRRFYGVARHGDIAYAAAGDYGLYVVNVADPSTPVLTQVIDMPGSGPERLKIEGGRLLAACYEGGLVVMDISQPTAPKIIGRAAVDPIETGFGFNTGAKGGAISGNFLFSAWEEDNMHISQIAPADPFTRLGHANTRDLLNFDGSASDIVVNGTTAYLAQGTQGITLANIANPAAPIVGATLDTPGSADKLVRAGNILAVTDGPAGIRFYDIAVPTLPTFLGAYDPDANPATGRCWDVHIQGTTAYVAFEAAGIHILNISDPTNPTMNASITTEGNAWTSLLMGETLVVGEGNRISLWNMANAFFPLSKGRLPLGGTPDSLLAISATEVLVGDTTGRSLRIVDVADDAMPLESSLTNTTMPPYSLDPLGNGRVAVGLGGGGLAIYNVADTTVIIRETGTSSVHAFGIAPLGSDTFAVASGASYFDTSEQETLSLVRLAPTLSGPVKLDRPRVENGACAMDFLAPSGASYRLMKSTDLQSWSFVRQVTGSGAIQAVSEPLPASGSKLFFRLHQP